ncbi:serine hydrolase domain-containing protein [Pseudochryseolinea flava]|uniref:Beta-lactamase-related domain-containing protein n=1 Tax=Pseudochryseolinea flava TaxID=2059302 RepID=A0A364Y638_9BACT|nr:serine hydrolase domain-containing protein [Pseudochryseolinea flava]RAW02546.1 hypothetical protein DQQ10_00040 [Pseudochryseolinea flava]
MKRCIYFLFLIAYCAAGTSSLHACQPDSLTQIIDSILFNHTGSDRPGATIGVIKDGELIFQKGYGMANIESHTPNHPQVTYNIASGSKQFTAAIIVSLARENKLKLTDDVRKYITELPDYGKTITLENLLYHTSGLRDYLVLMWLTGKSFEEKFTNADALKIITTQKKLSFTPGERCTYSNTNYLLLAEVVQRVTKKSLAQYAERHLFNVLGMRKSGFGRQMNVEGNSVSYYKSEKGYAPFKNNNITAGDGGMITTLPDLLQWDRSFYDSSSLAHHILTRGKLNGEELRFGMGIIASRYRGDEVHTHPGAFLGYRSEILRFPQSRITIVCLANATDINPEHITRAIADRYIFGAQTVVRHPKTNTLNAAQISAMIGTYRVNNTICVDIRNEDGILTGQGTGQPKEILHAASHDTLLIGETSDRVVFESFEHNKFQKIIIQQKHGNTTAQRLVPATAEEHSQFTGEYYCEDQNTSYHFYSENDALWFKVGTNPPVSVEAFKNQMRITFSYFDLERASIDFKVNMDGSIRGFVLNTGRIRDLEFVKR